MDTEKLVERIDAYVDEVWPQVLGDIASLVAVPSVADAGLAEPGSPHGPAAHEALRLGLGIASRLGLEARDLDGWIGYADLPGASERQVATIAHVDVVPAGQGWTGSPWEMRRREGYLLGRGVVDDKGPAVLSMYAAHWFARQAAQGRVLPYTLRVILGSDEEVGMTDVAHYLANEPQPAFLFTPDAEFPVCCGEKGRVSGSFVSDDLTGGRVLSFDGGTVSNAIPGLACCTVALGDGRSPDDLPRVCGIDVDRDGAGPDGSQVVRLTAHGKGGHASLPQGTRNAIGMLVGYLQDNALVSGGEAPFYELLGRIFASTDGSTLGIDATDDLFDPLTCIGGTIRMKDGRLVQTIDCRYPKSTTGQLIASRLQGLASLFGASFVPDSDMVPFYIDPENPCVRALVDSYNEFTGRQARPFTIGGGTYARHFANAVSFGPEEPGLALPAWVGPVHGPDEGTSEELLRRSLKIYIFALEKLMGLDL